MSETGWKSRTIQVYERTSGNRERWICHRGRFVGVVNFNGPADLLKPGVYRATPSFRRWDFDAKVCVHRDGGGPFVLVLQGYPGRINDALLATVCAGSLLRLFPGIKSGDTIYLRRLEEAPRVSSLIFALDTEVFTDGVA